jgi:hypothetical protein
METVMEQLAKALSAAQAEFGTVPQSGKNPFHKSTYSTIEDYVNAAKPVLAKNGLSISQAPNLLEGQFVLTTILMHESGEHIVSNQPIFAAKQDAQSMGSAITYARRYAYGAVLGMASGDFDDDGNAAADKPNKQANPPKSQSPAKSPAPPSPNKTGQGTPNQTIEERVNAVPHLGGLTALYDGMKGEIEAMEKAEQDKVLALFKQRKTELTKG